jgi:hypothetical protein
MPDMIQPVGALVQPPNPNQGLSQLSSILGIRQAQQNLQTGAINQQAAQANAQQDQQKNQELQSLSSFTKSATTDPAYHNPDGSLNVQKFQTDASAAAPTYGQAYIGQATSNANASIDNRKALLSLSNEQRATAGQIFGGLAANPKATPQDLQEAVDQARNLSDDPGWHKAMDRVLFSHPNTANMPDAQASQTVRQFARGVALQTGAKNAGQSDPNVSLVQTKAGQTPTNLNPQSPAGTGPVGSAIPLPPQLVILPDQQVGNRNPQTGAVSVAPMEGGAGASTTPGAPTGKLQPLTRPSPNAPKADQDAYNTQIAAAAKDVTDTRNAANDPINGVQSTRFRNQQIINLIPHASTGPGMKTLNTIASRLPGSTGDAYQDIEHYTAQNSAALAEKMGLPHTNLGAETSAAAAGSVEKNPGALAEITKTNDALNTAYKLYNNGMQKLTNNGSDVSKVNSFKQAFGSNLDVNAVRWADAHRRGDQDEIDALTQKLGKNGIEKAKQSLKTLKSLSETGDLP